MPSCTLNRCYPPPAISCIAAVLPPHCPRTAGVEIYRSLLAQSHRLNKILVKTMSTAITKNTIESLKATLASAPPPPRVYAVRECLIELLPVLREARARGHTAESMREILLSKNIKVTTRNVTDALRDGAIIAKPKRVKVQKTAAATAAD